MEGAPTEQVGFKTGDSKTSLSQREGEKTYGFSWSISCYCCHS